MGARRKGRELAVQALYQIELQGERSAEALQLFWEQADAGTRARAFAVQLVEAVEAQRPRIDELIATASAHWRVERLSTVDLTVLRVATAELLVGGTPTSVILDEAIEIARRFGSTDSSTFVNGVLDQIAGQLGVKETAAERSARQHG